MCFSSLCQTVKYGEFVRSTCHWDTRGYYRNKFPKPKPASGRQPLNVPSTRIPEATYPSQSTACPPGTSHPGVGILLSPHRVCPHRLPVLQKSHLGASFTNPVNFRSAQQMVPHLSIPTATALVSAPLYLVPIVPSHRNGFET